VICKVDHMKIKKSAYILNFKIFQSPLLNHDSLFTIHFPCFSNKNTKTYLFIIRFTFKLSVLRSKQQRKFIPDKSGFYITLTYILLTSCIALHPVVKYPHLIYKYIYVTPYTLNKILDTKHLYRSRRSKEKVRLGCV